MLLSARTRRAQMKGWFEVAVASMKIVNIVGPVSAFDSIARITGASGQFQPENAVSFYRTNDNASPMTQKNPWAAPAARLAASLPKGATISDGVSPMTELSGDEMIAEAEAFAAKMEELGRRCSECESDLSEKSGKIEKLSHFTGLSLNMKEITELEYTSTRFGRMPRSCFSRLDDRDRDGKLFAFKCTEDDVFTYFVIFCPKSYSNEMDRILSGLYFERIFVPETDTTVESRCELLAADIERTRRMIDDTRAEANELWAREGERMSRIYKALERESVYSEMRKYAAVYDDKFILVGWVPSHDGKKLISELEAIPEIELTVDNAASEAAHNPPVKLKNSRLTRPFEMFVDMYGMPSYGEFDPTPFVAVTYILLFGIMFGDLGQGILVSLVGWLMWKLKGMELGRILVRCGVSSAVFGCVFGSVFGFEHVLDPLYHALFGLDEKPIEVMTPATTNMIIYAAVGIGVVLVAAAMLINIFSCARRRDLENLLFGANGIPGLVFYCSLVAGLVCQLLLSIPVMSVPYIVCLIILPLILIFLKEPLGCLVTGKKEKIEWGNYLAQSFFELFETVLSYVTNTMSFLRVGAFVLVHAGMMMVVFTLAEMSSGVGYAAIVVIGNIVVSGLEGLLVAIQVLRLEFYEMFSRFFDGGGRPFVPAGAKEK